MSNTPLVAALTTAAVTGSIAVVLNSGGSSYDLCSLVPASHTGELYVPSALFTVAGTTLLVASSE